MVARHCLWRLAVLAVLAVLLLPTCCRGFRIALVADLHYDADYGTAGAFTEFSNAPCKRATAPLVAMGCESSAFLVASWIADLDGLTPRPELLVFAGDLARHDLPEANMSSTSDRAVSLMAKALEEHHLVPKPLFALGNNDLAFEVLVARQKNGSLPKAWNDVFLEGDDDATTFFGQGYYARRVKQVNLTILSINTAFLAVPASQRAAKRHAPSIDPRGATLLAWMRRELLRVEAAGGQAIVVGHVAPVGYRFSPFQSVRLQGAHYFAEYEAQYAALLQRFANVVVAQLFAHQHVGHISAATDTGGVPLVLTGSISPAFGLNPVYTVLDYDPSMRRLTRVAIRRLPFDASHSGDVDGGPWEWCIAIPQDVSPSHAQSGTAVDHVFLADVARRFVSNATLAKVMTDFSTGGTVSSKLDLTCDTACWTIRRCTLMYATAAGVRECTSSFRTLTSDQLVERFFFLFSITIVSAAALTCVARRWDAQDDAFLDGLSKRSTKSTTHRDKADEHTGAGEAAAAPTSWAPPSLFA